MHVARRKRPAAAAEDQKLQLRAWVRLMVSTNVALNWLRRALRDEFGLTLPAFDILMQIQRPPIGPTMGELSARLMVTKGNVSGLIDRLEAKALVSRRSNPYDGRLQHIYLTPAGETLLGRVIPRHRSWIAELTAGMDSKSLARLYQLLGAFRESAIAAGNRESGAAPVNASERSSRRRPKRKRRAK